LLQPLADPGGDDGATRTRLDDARAAYGEVYEEAEAISQSSVVAVRPRRKVQKGAPKPPPSLKTRFRRRTKRVLSSLGR
jgi:hypothetical protein